MDNKQLAEKKFLTNCGYTLDEVKQLMEGFGVTDPALPEGPAGPPNSIGTEDESLAPHNSKEVGDQIKAKIAAKFDRFQALVVQGMQGRVTPEMKELANSIKKYLVGELPIRPWTGVDAPTKPAAAPQPQGKGYSSF